jgi:hypothetical protein
MGIEVLILLFSSLSVQLVIQLGIQDNDERCEFGTQLKYNIEPVIKTNKAIPKYFRNINLIAYLL